MSHKNSHSRKTVRIERCADRNESGPILTVQQRLDLSKARNVSLKAQGNGFSHNATREQTKLTALLNPASKSA